MKLRSIFADLQGHQTEMFCILADVEAMLHAPAEVRDLNGVIDHRPRFLRILTDYQAFIHQIVCGPSATDEMGARSDHAIAIKADCIALSGEYAGFTQRWSGRIASDHWPEYRLSAIRMIRVIRQHLAYQREAVAELLAS